MHRGFISTTSHFTPPEIQKVHLNNVGYPVAAQIYIQRMGDESFHLLIFILTTFLTSNFWTTEIVSPETYRELAGKQCEILNTSAIANTSRTSSRTCIYLTSGIFASFIISFARWKGWIPSGNANSTVDEACKNYRKTDSNIVPSTYYMPILVISFFSCVRIFIFANHFLEPEHVNIELTKYLLSYNEVCN